MSLMNKINRECPIWEKLLIEVNDAVEHEPRAVAPGRGVATNLH